MNLFTNLFAQTAPPTGMMDVLKIPLLCFIVGMALWYGGLIFEARTEKTWMKWLAFVPLVIGIAIGLQDTIQVSDYVYQQTLTNRKTLYAHYVGLLLPLSGMVMVFCWHLYLKRSGSYDRI